MALTDDDVRQIARLSRIAIDPSQLPEYRRDLGRILEMFEALADVDTADIEPMAHPLEIEQRLRADEVTEGNERETFQKIAPQVADGLYVVPKVIE